MKLDYLDPIRIKLYPNEAVLLRNFLLGKVASVHQLRGEVYNGDLILVEWLYHRYNSRSISIEHGSNKVPKRVDIPVGVARYLLQEMTLCTIPVALNIVLGQIHRALCNRNFLPTPQ